MKPIVSVCRLTIHDASAYDPSLKRTRILLDNVSPRLSDRQEQNPPSLVVGDSMVLIPPKNWDEYDEMQKLIEKTPELSRLYRSLGYSASIDRATKEALQSLRSLLQIEIPDYTVFQKYVARVQAEIEKCERGEFLIPDEINDPNRRKLWEDMAHPLFDNLGQLRQEWKDNFWKAARTASRNKSKLNDVVKMLETAYEGYRDAKDRLPLDDDSFFTLKITDKIRFGELLDKLQRCLTYCGSVVEFLHMLQASPIESDALVEANWHERARQPVKEVLAEIVELRKNYEGSNLWATLCDIRRKVESIMRLDYDLETQAKKQQLDQILVDVVRAQHELATEKYAHLCDFYKDEIVAHIDVFIISAWMHSDWLRNYLLTGLLDTYLVALTRVARSDPNRWTSELPQPWGVLVPSLLSFIFFVSATIGIYILFETDMHWLAYLGIIYLFWHYFLRFFRNFQLAKGRGAITQVASILQLIRDEVRTGHYQPEEITRRLRQLEEKNFHIHSIVFPLLGLPGLRTAADR
jgi:hypothetical protein